MSEEMVDLEVKEEGARSLKKLKEAVEQQASSLDPAQREFVLAEFETYKWNNKKIGQLEKRLTAGGIDVDTQAKYFKQRHQLVAEQSSLFTHIMQWLKGTASTKSKLDQFLDG